MVRDALELSPLAPVDIETLVSSEILDHAVPRGIEALGSSTQTQPLVVVGRASRRRDSRHFKQARALSRYLFGGAPALFIVTQTTSLRDRAEGAFAAELLAPAAGVESFLSDHVDDEDRERAAQHFGVSTRVIDHQLENHLGVSASW